MDWRWSHEVVGILAGDWEVKLQAAFLLWSKVKAHAEWRGGRAKHQGNCLLVDKIHRLTGKEDVLGSKISPEMVGNMVKDRAQGSKMHALRLGFFYPAEDSAESKPLPVPLLPTRAWCFSLQG